MLNKLHFFRLESTKLMALIFIIILFVPVAAAIGISPGKRTFEYNPGKEDKVEIKVYNNDNVDFIASISVKGELEDYIEVSDKKLEFNEGLYKKSFYYKFTHPHFINIGNYTSRIIVEQELTGEYTGLSTGPNLKVSSILFLRADSPTEYATDYPLSVFDYKKNLTEKINYKQITSLWELNQNENNFSQLNSKFGLIPYCFSCSHYFN